MPVATLMKHEVVDVGQVRVLLAERHDVDVVVDEHRHVEAPLHVAGHVVAVPAGHDRRVDRAPGRVLHGPGQADADRRRGPPVSRRCSASSSRDRRLRPSRAPLGAVGDVEVLATSTRTVPARSARAAVAWVAPMSTPATTQAPGLRAKQRRRPAAGGRPAERRRPGPGACSASIRAAMVERASPVVLRQLGARPGLPSRSSSKRSPARTCRKSTTRTSARPARNFCRPLDRSA